MLTSSFQFVAGSKGNLSEIFGKILLTLADNLQQ